MLRCAVRDLVCAQTTGETEDFFIGHFVAQLSTNSSSSRHSYSSVSDYRSSCRIDNARVPVSLGLSIPFLLLACWSMHKRRAHHGAHGWRRTAVGAWIIFGGWSFLACVFWWHGCFAYVMAAVDDQGQLAYNTVVFTGYEPCAPGLGTDMRLPLWMPARTCAALLAPLPHCPSPCCLLHPLFVFVFLAQRMVAVDDQCHPFCGHGCGAEHSLRTRTMLLLRLLALACAWHGSGGLSHRRFRDQPQKFVLKLRTRFQSFIFQPS